MTLRVSDFDYELDPALIAQQPLGRRSDSRLLVLDRASGRQVHARFSRLWEFLRSGDLLVLNDTRVIPAKFTARRKSGAKIEGLFLAEPAPGRWQVLLKGAGRCKRGELLELAGCKTRLALLENHGQGRWDVAPTPSRPAERILGQIGATPLPPYIRRRGLEHDRRDRRRYQTVYAARPGAVAAPTAGLHFTPGLLRKLAQIGIETACVTLHVGLGTFAPVKTERIEDHKMHAEWYDLPAQTASKINRARRQGRRVVAVGTTSVRVLETVARTAAPLQPTSGWTDIFIYPPAEFRLVDALITNFHLPRSTLLMLAAAFCCPGGTDGVAMILQTYREAMQLGYRFYSYGDAMLII